MPNFSKKLPTFPDFQRLFQKKGFSRFTRFSTIGISTPVTSQQQQSHQTKKSEDFIQKQQKILEELVERVDRLEGTVSAMESELAVV